MQIETDLNQMNKKKGPKITTVLIIMMTIIIIAAIGVIIAILSLQKQPLRVSVDGLPVALPADTFMFGENGKIYVSIRDIAPQVGYTAHNGEYKVDTEDTNKMYIQANDETETTSFYLNSTTINKVAPNTTDN